MTAWGTSARLWVVSADKLVLEPMFGKPEVAAKAEYVEANSANAQLITDAFAQIKAAVSGTYANIQQLDVGGPATEVSSLAQPGEIPHSAANNLFQAHYSNWQDSQVTNPVQYGQSSNQQYLEGSGEQYFDDSGEISGMTGTSQQVQRVKGKEKDSHHRHHKKR